MATYREIHGKAIKSLSSDPSDDAVAGQIWYNTATESFKSVLASTAWSSGAPRINTLKTSVGFGTQTSAVSAAGNSSSTTSEEYNGSGWVAGGTLNTGRFYLGGAGASVSSGRVFGGRTAPTSQSVLNEAYDGTSWSEAGGDLTTGRTCTGLGTKDAALAFGGSTGPGPSGGSNQNLSEEWNGTSWTEGPNLNTPRSGSVGAGTQTAGLCIAGQSTGNTNATEEYNGATWTSVNDIPTGREGMFGWGTQDSAVAASGQSPYITTTFTYDGTDWSTSTATIGTANSYGSSAGLNATAGVASGGEAAPGTVNTTELFNSSTNVITPATFSSSGNVPQAVQGGGSGGTQTAAWLAGGLQYPGDTKNKTWTYDGSSWTAAPNVPNNFFIGGSTGPNSAGLLFDGHASYGPGTATYEWDGSSWTGGGAITAVGPGGSQGITGTGTQTAALGIGGIGDPPPAGSPRVLDYNGASWTTGTSTPGDTGGAAGDGPNSATWIGGGKSQTTSSYEFNGSSWTAGGSIITALPQSLQAQGWGPQTSAIIAGGTASAPTSAISQTYDGSNWSTGPNMSVPRVNSAQSSQSAGTTTGFVMGGYPPTLDDTENYDAGTSAINVKTLTQS